MSVRLTPELAEALAEHARQTGRTLSDVVRQAIEDGTRRLAR